MPNRSSKMRPRDLNRLAASIVQDATSDESRAAQANDKNPAAVELGRLGGKKGGPARAARLTKRQRSEIAKKAARTRWAKSGQA
jgi:hypothetical protein